MSGVCRGWRTASYDRRALAFRTSRHRRRARGEACRFRANVRILALCREGCNSKRNVRLTQSCRADQLDPARCRQPFAHQAIRRFTSRSSQPRNDSLSRIISGLGNVQALPPPGGGVFLRVGRHCCSPFGAGFGAGGHVAVDGPKGVDVGHAAACIAKTGVGRGPGYSGRPSQAFTERVGCASIDSASAQDPCPWWHHPSVRRGRDSRRVASRRRRRKPLRGRARSVGARPAPKH